MRDDRAVLGRPERSLLPLQPDEAGVLRIVQQDCRVQPEGW